MRITACFMGLILMGMACDLVPNKPDFSTSHKLELPLLNQKTFVFLGDSTGALIDTTSEDFDSLFTIGGDGLISISTEEEFNLGDLNDAIPEVQGSTTNFNSQVGEIELGSFSSGTGDLGSTNFAEITGGPEPPSGTVVPAGSNSSMPVNINIGSNTDYFVSATMSSGALELTVTNNLGFDLSGLDITLLAGGSPVGTVASFGPISNGATSSASVTFSDGDVVNNISVDVVISWNTFVYPDHSTTGDLIVNTANGVNLFASSVTANVEPQSFSTSNTSTFTNTEFQFNDPSHYIELSSGQISITNFINNLGVDIETLQISFPDIRNGSFTAADSLVINYPVIAANSSVADQLIDLTGYRIYALGNSVTYNIVAATENTQTGGVPAVTISETDFVSADVDISGLTIAEAFGTVLTQQVTLGDDDPSNGTDVLDIYNSTEVELTEIDGLDAFSDQFDGLDFTNPQISINYQKSFDIETTVYGVLLGINNDGTAIYLTGNAGSPYEVQPSDPVTGLQENGVDIPKSNMIKFNLGTGPTGSIQFDSTNTNVAEFLNNLPSEIRFIGKAVVNESGGDATISTPLTFDPTFSVDLPLQFQTTTSASFTDTLETDLSDLPSSEKGDEQTLESGQFYLVYTNNLPLGLNLELHFLDSLDNQIPGLSLPVSGESLNLIASPIDPVTKFSDGATEQSLIFSVSESQLPLLYRTRKIELTATMNTTANGEVKLRASDSVILSFGAKLSLGNKVGGE